MSRAVSTDVDLEGEDTGAEVRDLSEREVRALTEYMIVLPPRLAPRADERSGVFHVTGARWRRTRSGRVRSVKPRCPVLSSEGAVALDT